MFKNLRTLGVIALSTLAVFGGSAAAQAAPSTVTILTGFHSTAGVAFSLDGKTAYVVQDDDGTMGGPSSLVVIDTTTLTQVGDAISTGVNGAGVNHSIVMSPDGTKAYVSLGTGIVKPFYPATLTFGPAITVGTAGIGQVVFTPDGLHAYVAVTNNGSGQYVKVIDVVTDSVTATISACSAPDGLAMTPDGLTVFVNCSDGSVQVIETTGNTVLTTFTPAGHLQGTMITMAPDGARVYVTAFAIPTTVTTVIDTTTYDEIHQFTDDPKDVAFSSDGAAAYIFSDSSGDLVPTNSVTFAEGTPIDVIVPSPGDWFLLDKNPIVDQYWICGGSSIRIVGQGPSLADTGANSTGVTVTTLASAGLIALGLAITLTRRRRA